MELRGGLPPAVGTQREWLCHRTGVAFGQRGRQSAPCSDGAGADHQHRSHSFDGQRRRWLQQLTGTRGTAGSWGQVVSIGGAKGKKIIEAQQWKSQPYRQARAERSAIESLVFTLK